MGITGTYFISTLASQTSHFVLKNRWGGHASGGGAIFLARSDLDNWAGDWRWHLKLAGCEWVIEIVETR